MLSSKLVRMARDNVVEGVFAINKPIGLSSAQVIRDCQTYFNPSAFFKPLIQREVDMRMQESRTNNRRRSKAKRDMRVKMGHGGTLDPLATGVLILGVGRGTKELNQFLFCKKTYETIVLFGASTDTYDRCGRILKHRSYSDITRAKVEEALESFRGTYQQMPPLYSALKMNGKPLYEYARQGQAIPREIETREVEVSELEIVEWYEPGEHNHRWPAEEAGMAEQSLAERVWRVEKDQAAGKTQRLSAEEEKSDREALAAHEDFKRRAEEKQDELVYDRPPKRRRGGGGADVIADDRRAKNNNANNKNAKDDQLMMSGALGNLPTSYEESREAAAAAAIAEVEAAKAEAKPSASPETAPAPAATNANGVTPDAETTKGEQGGNSSSSANSTAGAAPEPVPQHKPGRGSNLVQPAPSLNTPPPWEGKGPPAVKIRMTVTSGFYVRSFCHDLGEKLGSAALMAELARTKVSDFRAGSGNCLEYSDILKGEAVWGPKISDLLKMWHNDEVAQGAGIDDATQTTEGGEKEQEQESKSVGTESEFNGFSDVAEDAPSPPDS